MSIGPTEERPVIKAVTAKPAVEPKKPTTKKPAAKKTAAKKD